MKFAAVFGTTISLLLAPFLWSQPSDMSVAAFEQFQSRIDQEVEKILDGEFNAKVEEIKKLETPYKKGEQVSVTIIQGDRQRQLIGVFNGIKGQYAVIDDRTYLLTDIAEIDSKRLYFADQAQLLQLTINQMRKKVEEDRAKRKQILMDLHRKEAGYTSEFLDSTVRLGGKFWTMDLLGDKAIRIQLSLEEGSEFAAIDMVSGIAISPTIYVLLGNDPLYASTAEQATASGESSPGRKKLSFKLLTSDLSASGGDLFDVVQQGLRVWLYEPQVGSWYLTPSLDGAPEASGTGKKATYTLRLAKSSVKDDNPALERQFQELTQAARAHQDKVEGRVKELTSVVEAEQKEKEREIQERAARIRELEEARKAKEDLTKSLEEPYEWFTPDTVPVAEEERATASAVITLETFDNVQYPAKMNDMRVLRFTDWIKIPSRNREMYGQKYRVLRATDSADSPVYYLQYQLSTTNPKSSVSQLTIQATVSFEGGADASKSATFEMQPSWAGALCGIVEISIDSMKLPIATVSLSKTE